MKPAFRESGRRELRLEVFNTEKMCRGGSEAVLPALMYTSPSYSPWANTR